MLSSVVVLLLLVGKLLDNRYLLSLLSALLLWDNVVTFGDEVSKIWSKKISGGTVLYALLRYGTAVEKVTVMLLASWYMTPRVCFAASSCFAIFTHLAISGASIYSLLK